MPYLVDPGGAPSATDPRECRSTIVLVGCGGTGGFLAESICRLLIGRPSRLFLVDPDRVEPHNVARQAFDRREVGRFKAEVLAERLARRFEREIGYSVLPYDRRLHASVFGDAASGLRLLVGCVDNAAARRAIATTLDALLRRACDHGTSGGSTPATVATPARYCWVTRPDRTRCAGRSRLHRGDVEHCRLPVSSDRTC